MASVTRSRPKAASKAAARAPAKKAAKAAAKTAAKTSRLGELPEWNLADLYPAIDSPQIERDLKRADADSIAFEASYKGRLAALTAEGKLVEAIKNYEALEDLLGRLISYAGLVYAGNTTDPVRAKFYGDMQERITRASLHLLFFTLELNRIDDAA